MKTKEEKKEMNCPFWKILLGAITGVAVFNAVKWIVLTYFWN